MALTPRQVEQFVEGGFLDLGSIFSAPEIEAYRAAYDSCLDTLKEEAGGELADISRPPRPDQQVHQIRAAHLQHELFAQLVRDSRITDAIADLVAEDLKIILCQGLYKPPRNGGELDWHQDDAYFETESSSHKIAPLVSCWITFDDATVESGCMWVVPGAHVDGVVEHTNKTRGLSLLVRCYTASLPVYF